MFISYLKWASYLFFVFLHLTSHSQKCVSSSLEFKEQKTQKVVRFKLFSILSPVGLIMKKLFRNSSTSLMPLGGENKWRVSWVVSNTNAHRIPSELFFFFFFTNFLHNTTDVLTKISFEVFFCFGVRSSWPILIRFGSLPWFH